MCPFAKFLDRMLLLAVLLALIQQIHRLTSVQADFIPPHILSTSAQSSSAEEQQQQIFLVLASPPLSAYSIAENTVEEYEEKIHQVEDGNLPEEAEEAVIFSAAPRTWRVIVNDLCQLPNVRRPTERQDSFVECVPPTIDEKMAGQTLLDGRKDLGIWRRRNCPVGTGFVPSVQICLPKEMIRHQQQLVCSSRAAGDNNQPSATVDGCGTPAVDDSEMWPTVHRKLPPSPKCPDIANALENSAGKIFAHKTSSSSSICEKKHIDMLEPCPVPTMSRLRRQYAQMRQQQQQIPQCPCPPQRTNCICIEAQTNQPQMFMDCCCVQRQLPPCLCTPIQPVPAQSLPVPPPPHLVDSGAPGQQMFRVEIHQPLSQAASPPHWAMPAQQQQHFGGISGGYGAREGISGGGPMQPPPPPPPPEPPMPPPQPCPLVEPASLQNAHFQEMCSWMLDPLVPDPESRSHFLQCQPAPFNLLCGRWQRMPCAPSTVFDQREQLCVWDAGGPPVMPSGPPVQPNLGWNQPGNGQGGSGSSFIVPARKVLECTCQCRTGGIPLGPCSTGLQCPTPAVCQTGLATPQIPCTMCCLYRNGNGKR